MQICFHFTSIAGLFKARLQIISTYICIKIVYTICCKIMESSKLKIFFFCYGNVYMLRGGREKQKERWGEAGREGGGKDITMCLQTPTTRRGGKRREKEGRRKMIQFGFEHTHNDLFQELTRCCLKSAHRRKTKPSQSLALFLTHTYRIRELPLSGWHPLSSTVYIVP